MSKTGKPMKMISTSGRGNFKLLRAEEEVFELEYKNWYSGKAKTRYRDQTIEFRPKNIWATKIQILKNDKDIGELTFTGKGEVAIKLTSPTGKKTQYSLKNRAKWKLKFDVVDEAGTVQLVLKASNNWFQINYNYEVDGGDYNSEFDVEELLIYCGYAANFYLAILSAV
jgi:hypothetical protein